jgi:hypothetical protein
MSNRETCRRQKTCWIGARTRSCPAPPNPDLPADVVETLTTCRDNEKSMASRWDGLDRKKMRMVAGIHSTSRAHKTAASVRIVREIGT